MIFMRARTTLSSLLAELSCIYPFYLLLTAAIGAQPIASPWPLLTLAGIVAIINLILSTGHRRLLTIVLLNLFLAVVASGWIMKQTFFPTRPFLSFSWIREMFSPDQALAISAHRWLLLIIIFCIYWRATLLARKSPNFAAAITRFDICLASLGGFFLIAALSGTNIPDAIAWMLIMLLSNVIAITSVQAGNRLTKHSAWIGPLFLILILFPGTLAITFFFPELSLFGTATYDTALPIVRWLGNLLLCPLIWLLTRARMLPEKPVSSSTDTATSLPQLEKISPGISLPDWLTSLAVGLGKLLIFFFFLAAIGIIIYLLYLLVSKLWRHQEPSIPSNTFTGKNLFNWWHSLIALFLGWITAARLAALPWLGVHQGAIESYLALLRWGKRQKQPRYKHETPFEYLQRLLQSFPEYQAELSQITESYVSYRYGGQPQVLLQGKLKVALRRLSLASWRRFFVNLQKSARIFKFRPTHIGNKHENKKTTGSGTATTDKQQKK